MDRLVCECVDGCVCVCMDEWVGGWVQVSECRWMDGWIGGWGWIGG
jgi:hypothetical protein